MTEFKGRIGRGCTSFSQISWGRVFMQIVEGNRLESLSDERGREKGFEALYDMSATKTIVANHR